MIIDNPDALRVWLSNKLGPLCDADPAALAKYVFALVKKDKPSSELRRTMITQLDVFLQKETPNFVDALFHALETQSYLPPSEIKPKPAEDTTVALQVTANHSETTNGVSLRTKEEPPPVKRKSESEKEEPRRRIRHRSPTPPLRSARSRSRSWERARRSRSRERGVVRSRGRKLSPLPSRRRDRRSSWSKSPPARNRSRSRSRSPVPRHRRYQSPSRSPGAHEAKKATPNSGAATPTQDSNHGDVDMRLTTTSQSIQSVVSAPEHSTAAAAVAASYKRRCRDFDEKGYCMRGDLCPYDHGTDPVVLEDMTIGSLAFPTGTTAPPPLVPVIPGAVVPTRPPPLVPPLHHDPTGSRMPVRHLRNAPEYNPDAPSIGRGWFRPGFRGQPGRGGARGARLPQLYNAPQRELISVPVSDNAVAPEQDFNDGQSDFLQADGAPPAKKPNLASVTSMPQTFDFSRLGPRKGNPANCSLELKKVPRGLNNITHLNNHFSRFGKIVNIQVNYDGDPEGAIVTFSSHAEANAAYRSTEAVLNNRFIKVFWHNKKPEGKQENVPPAMRMSVRDRLGHSSKVLNLVQPKVDTSQLLQGPLVEEKVILSGNNLTKTVYIPTALKKPDSALQENSKALAAAAIIKSQEILAAKETLKKKQEEKRKEALKLTANLRKRKQELLEMQLSQQKLLIERLEKQKSALKSTEQKTLMDTIKGLQESIEKIKKDLAPQPPPALAPRKTKEEALKEILDAELDLFTRQQEGRESLELKQRVAELKLEAHSLGLLGAGRGRGSLRARGSSRGAFRSRGIGRGRRGVGVRGGGVQHAHTSLDHRPTRLLVSGHECEEWKDVLAHFSQFGEIADYTPDHQTPALDIVFKTRKDAESALLQGRTFRDRVLSVTWSQGLVSSGVVAVTPIGTPPTTSIMQSQPIISSAVSEHQDNDDLLDDLLNAETDDIIYEDEEELGEEEEDLEERSWRR